MTDIPPIGAEPIGASEPTPDVGFSVSPTESDILTALRAFLLDILGDNVEVVKGQANKVPEPGSPDFVVMTHVYRKRLATNTDDWTYDDSDPAVIARGHSTMSDVQLDIHGPNSTDNAQAIVTLWRDDYACREINAAIFQPLYASDGHQMPFINGENQYEDRWVVTVTLQATPIISTREQFTSNLSPDIIALGSANP